MGWIKVEQALTSHHKTFSLADTLNISQAEAVGILVGFWTWALDNVDETGALPEVSNRMMRRICGTEAEDILGALIQTGFIDEYPGEHRIHNWEEYGGKCITEQNAYRDKLKKAREAKAEYRARKNQEKKAGVYKDKTTELYGDKTTELYGDRTIETYGDNAIEFKDETRQDETRQDETRRDNINICPSAGADKEALQMAFESVWGIYPKKVGKQSALKAFTKLNPNPELLTAIRKAITEQKQTPQWRKDGGQFIPYMATWLNGRRWEDELKSDTTPDTSRNGSFQTDEFFRKAQERAQKTMKGEAG